MVLAGTDTEPARDGRHDEGRVRYRREINEDDVRIASLGHQVRDLERDAGLANAARAGERDE